MDPRATQQRWGQGADPQLKAAQWQAADTEAEPMEGIDMEDPRSTQRATQANASQTGIGQMPAGGFTPASSASTNPSTGQGVATTLRTQGTQDALAAMRARVAQLEAEKAVLEAAQVNPRHTLPLRMGHGEAPKIRVPWTYDGTRDDDMIEEWITCVKDYIEYFERHGGCSTQADAITCASSYLRGDGKKCWVTRKNMDSRPEDLNYFFEVIRHGCGEVNGQERTRTKYNTLRQTKSARDFAYDLFHLAERLDPKPPDSEILERYKTGLQLHVRARLAEQVTLPTNLGDFVDFCDRIDRNWYEHRHLLRDARKESSPYLAAMQTPAYGKSKPAQGGAKPAKGTEQWKQWCRENKACYGCGSLEHGVRDCPSQQSLPARGAATSARGRRGSFGRRSSFKGHRQRSRSRSESRRPFSNRRVSFTSGSGKV